ncbi:MAG: family 2 glycosyl transferase [Anaerolineales bacterium]|nr:MAG: family 2 glycosyl transferase [Anaerolineales bacterium]
MTVSIVIRACNEEQHIGKLLDGIAHQSIQDVETILVDSGSTDHTLEIAAAYPVQVVHIQPDEFTFGYSLNRGISESHGEYIVIASAHIYPVYPDWLECLLKPFTDPQVALTYGKQRGNACNKFSEQQIFHHWYPEHSQPHQPYPFCNNANAAIRRSVWQSHHYDETLPGLEDLAWAHQIMAQGHAISYTAEAEVVHIHDETPTAVYNRYRREAMAFKRLFPQERYNLWNLAHNLVTNITSDARQAAHQKKLASHFAEICWFRWMQFWGTYRGYRQSGPLTWQLRQTFYYPRMTGFPPASLSRQVAPIPYTSNINNPAEEK